MAQKAGRWKNILLVLVIAPFFTSFLIRTLAWRNILSDDGPVVAFAQSIGFTSLLQAVGLTDNDTLLASKFAVICGLTYNFLPFMILPLYASLERLDPRLVEAAGDLYASPRRGVPAGSPGRCRCRESSPARCSPSSPPRATSSTRGCSATPRP